MRGQILLKVSNIWLLGPELSPLEFKKIVKFGLLAFYSPQFSTISLQTYVYIDESYEPIENEQHQTIRVGIISLWILKFCKIWLVSKVQSTVFIQFFPVLHGTFMLIKAFRKWATSVFMVKNYLPLNFNILRNLFFNVIQPIVFIWFWTCITYHVVNNQT